MFAVTPLITETAEPDKGIVEKTVAAILEATRNQTLIVTFNGLGFDLPVIRRRACYCDVDYPTHVNSWLTKRYANEHHVDLMYVLSDGDRSRWKGHDFYAKRFGLGGKNGSAADVYPWWKQGRIGLIAEYNRQELLQLAAIYQAVRQVYSDRPADGFMCLDIETIPHQNLPDGTLPKVKYGNAKSDEAKAKKEAEAELSRDKDMSTDPDLCQIVCVGLFDSATNEVTTIIE